MIAIILKHSTEKVPAGVLCFHTHTLQLVCKGLSPLSVRILNDYKNGFTFYSQDRFLKVQKQIYFGNDYNKFKQYAPTYYEYAGFVIREEQVKDSETLIDGIELVGVTDG